MPPTLSPLRAWPAAPAAGQARVWLPTDPALRWSPYTWKCDVHAPDGAVAEACMPGAYLQLRITGTTRLGLQVDLAAQAGSPPGTAPVVEYALDDRPYQTLQLDVTPTGSALLLADGLTPDAIHALHLVFRAGTLIDRWQTRRPRLRIQAILADAASELLPAPRRPRTIIGWGDSITEGVGVDALFTSWTELAPNHARGTWLPVVAQVLDAEYGQLGTGGQSLSATIPGGLPPLMESWAVFDASQASRLVDGLLTPPPDAIFCNMGTNDRVDPSAAYALWLDAVRQAAPQAVVFVVVPINGFWRAEISALVGRQRLVDPRVVLIDCPQLQGGAPARGQPTSLAYDGAHPTLHGEMLFGALIAAQAVLALQRLTPQRAAAAG